MFSNVKFTDGALTSPSFCWPTPFVWGMENYRHCLDPEDMTPEERLDRIVELLAVASVRLAQKEREAECPAPTENGLDSSPKSV